MKRNTIEKTAALVLSAALVLFACGCSQVTGTGDNAAEGTGGTAMEQSDDMGSSTGDAATSSVPTYDDLPEELSFLGQPLGFYAPAGMAKQGSGYYGAYDASETIGIVYGSYSSTSNDPTRVFEDNVDTLVAFRYPHPSAVSVWFEGMMLYSTREQMVNDFDAALVTGSFSTQDAEDLKFVGYAFAYEGRDYWFYALDNTADQSTAASELTRIAEEIASTAHLIEE